MKKLKLSGKLFFSFFSLFLFFSCSSDDSQTSNSDFSQMSRLGVETEVQDYLDDFYGQTFHFGDSIQTSEKGIDYLVTEVILDTDTRARGYVAVELSTNKFLYFVDVDRINYNLYTDNILENSNKIFQNIDRLPDYTSTNELDFIKITSDVNQGSPQTSRFWGWGKWQYSPCIDGKKNAIRIYHIIWLSADFETRLGIPCDTELNPIKDITSNP
ncbi:MAG: hypothetical protein ACOVLC_11930 [Flavobacterium sp.]